MAAGTALSRLTGLIRTMALASALGVTATSDAYNTANTAPTMIFTLVAGGALSAAVVPTLVRAGDRRAEVASVLLGATLLLGAAASVLVAILAPELMRLLTAGARDRVGYSEFVALGSSWLRMFAPQVSLYALSVLAVAIMTARRRLVLGATAPVVTNLLTIGTALAYLSVTQGRLVVPGAVPDRARFFLGWGTTVAVAAMTAIQVIGAFRVEPGMRVRVQFRHPAVRTLARLGGWVVVYVMVNQAGLAVVTALASSVPGGITAYQWGFMVMQLPYAVIAVSVLSAALPSIAEQTDVGARAAAIAAPARSTLTWLMPAAVGLFVLAEPVSTLVVGAGGASLVGAAVRGFAASLVPFSLFQLLTRACYALSDSRTPAFVNLAVNVANVGAASVVMAVASTSTQRVIGLALSHALSYVIGCCVLGALLDQRQLVQSRSLTSGVARVAVATAPMTVALMAASGWAASLGSRGAALGGVAVLAAAGVAIFVGAARLFGVPIALNSPADGTPGRVPHSLARRSGSRPSGSALVDALEQM